MNVEFKPVSESEKNPRKQSRGRTILQTMKRPRESTSCSLSYANSEAQLAAVALGLDPGLGILHVDTPARDSLACDLMRLFGPRLTPLCWIGSSIRRSNENVLLAAPHYCRLMDPFAVQLSATASMWLCGVAPVAESVVQ